MKKYLSFVLIIGCIVPLSFVRADDISDMKTSLTDTITKLLQKYEARIQELETENKTLKQELVSLKTNTPVITTIPVKITPETLVVTSTTAKSDVYNAVIKQTNANLGTLLSENYLPGYSVIGLFEFIEPNAVFLSLDDGNNPAWVTAFKTKILYTFDNNLSLTKIGLFDLDYASQKYRTVFGSNPYVKSVRTRIQNPNYKGKLLETVAPVSSNNVTSGNTSSATVTGTDTEVTFAQVKAAYDKNRLLDALKLSDKYIATNPDNLDVLRIRYRSYYMIGKYENSLVEIRKIETIQGSSFERTIACDAAVIGKIAKKTDVSTYYSTICKKK